MTLVVEATERLREVVDILRQVVRRTCAIDHLDRIRKPGKSQDQLAFVLSWWQNLSRLEALFGCLAQDRLDTHCCIKQVWSSTSLEARELVEVEQVIACAMIDHVGELHRCDADLACNLRSLIHRIVDRDLRL